MHNIEPSAFSKGRYIGYADGVWIIERGDRQWLARHRENRHARITARTLREVSALLDGVKPVVKFSEAA